MRALPAYYAGITFRSRLEARWAWTFDQYGWDWQYEPQGYALTTGWFCPQEPDWQDSDRRCGEVGEPDDLDTKDVSCWHVNYLPDFYVDQVGWVEVKGRLGIRDVQIAAMSALGERGGLPVAPDGDYLDGYTNADALHVVGSGGWDRRVTVNSLYKGLVYVGHEPWGDEYVLFHDAPEWADGWLPPPQRNDLTGLRRAAGTITDAIGGNGLPHVKFDRRGRLNA